MTRLIRLGRKKIGLGEPPYFLAEIGSNHNGDMSLCKRLVDKARECGADAVKFQSFTEKSLISKAEYEKNTRYGDKKRHFGTLLEMVKKYQFTRDQHLEISNYCRTKGITFVSTPFSFEEVDLLEKLHVPYYKIASMDINNHNLLSYIARKGKPVLLSTGMATLGEIEEAVKTITTSGNPDVVLLYCLSVYPPKYQDINLNNIISLGKVFNLPVGFSDHTIGISIPLAAIALGAVLIEKHFTLNKDLEGWDHWISADPPEFADIVNQGKNVHKALGSYERQVNRDELIKRKKFRRSIVLRRNLAKNTKIKISDIDFKRPGTGIPPDMSKMVVGRSLKRNMEEDEMVLWKDLI